MSATTINVTLDVADLAVGDHSECRDGYCLRADIASAVGDDPAVYQDQCVSAVLRTIVCELAQVWDQTPARVLLDQVLGELVGTGDTRDDERAYLVTNWLARDVVPMWLDVAGLAEVAQRLRSLRVLDDQDAVTGAAGTIREAADLLDPVQVGNATVLRYADQCVALSGVGAVAMVPAYLGRYLPGTHPFVEGVDEVLRLARRALHVTVCQLGTTDVVTDMVDRTQHAVLDLVRTMVLR